MQHLGAGEGRRLFHVSTLAGKAAFFPIILHNTALIIDADSLSNLEAICIMHLLGKSTWHYRVSAKLIQEPCLKKWVNHTHVLKISLFVKRED